MKIIKILKRGPGINGHEKQLEFTDSPIHPYSIHSINDEGIKYWGEYYQSRTQAENAYKNR